MVCELPTLSDTAKYSVKDVCEILGIHRDTLREWRIKLIIPTHYHKCNNRPFFLARDIRKVFNGEY